uniref:Cnd1_N domain-containing protein n=1 Tax=Macrostomum lignano TaxID=282301 RepID=A0A1I8F8A9_9PLAT
PYYELKQSVSARIFLPVARRGFAEARAPRQFYVSELFWGHSLPARLKECRGLLQSHRSLFPCTASMRSTACSATGRTLPSPPRDAWDILAECCHFTVVSLAKSLGDVTGDSARNVRQADPGTKKGRKKKASSAACAEMIRLRWDDEVSGLVEQVKQLCLLQLHMLWEPPVIEEDFVNLIGDLCFRVLDNPSFIRIQEVREPVTSILTRLVRSYNYSRTGAIKLSQLLVMCEQPQPNQVVHLVNGFLAGQQNDMRCFKNTAGTGALCTFLVEFTQLHPDIAEQSLPHFKIWLQIVEAKSLPYERMGRLVELIAGAAGLAAGHLRHGQEAQHEDPGRHAGVQPGCAGVPTDQLNADFEREVKILQELEASQDPELGAEGALPGDAASIPRVLQLLRPAVSRAIRLFALAHDAFTDNPIFSTRIEEVPNSDSQPASASQAEAQSQKLRVQAWTDRLKDIYMGEATPLTRASRGLRPDCQAADLHRLLRQSLQFDGAASRSAMTFVVHAGRQLRATLLEAVASCSRATSQGMASARPALQQDAGGPASGSRRPPSKQALVSAYEKMYTEVFVDQDAGTGADEAEKAARVRHR